MINNIQSTYGYNPITYEDDQSGMLMDFGLLKLKENGSEQIFNSEKESALLLLKGDIILEWENKEVNIKRESCFDEKPYALHVCKAVDIKISAKSEAELIVQKTTNEKTFKSNLYGPDDCVENVFGDGLMQGTAKRFVRDIFNYHNAPYSNMVLGEVITLPGKWSSYPPHSHPQPEIYFYKFDKPQGFGISIIGDNAYKVENNYSSLITGNLVHPQVSAPGYAMYYCWAIRHLPKNPWIERVDDPKHKWLYNKNSKIWNHG